MTSTVDLRLGDCLDILPTLPDKSVDAIITDPPYSGQKGGIKSVYSGVAPLISDSVTLGTPWGENLDALKEFKRIARYGAIVFCSWHSIGEVRSLLGGTSIGLITWYKRNTQPSLRNRPHYSCEYAWLIEYTTGMNWKPLKTFYDIPGLPAGCFAKERVLQEGSKKAPHPTQKPIALMNALIEASPHTVLDPFMGTGTTGIACINTGRDFVGIEIDPKYFAIAQKRIEEAQQQLLLPIKEVT